MNTIQTSSGTTSLYNGNENSNILLNPSGSSSTAVWLRPSDILLTLQGESYKIAIPKDKSPNWLGRFIMKYLFNWKVEKI